MMAEKVENLLKKVKPGKVLLIGGVTKNTAVINFLRKKVPDIIIPAERLILKLWELALYGLENEVNIIESQDDIFIDRKSSFVFHQPIKGFKD